MIIPEVKDEEMKAIEEYLKKIDCNNSFSNVREVLNEYYEYKLRETLENTGIQPDKEDDDPDKEDDKSYSSPHRV